MALADFYEVRLQISFLAKSCYLVFHVRRLSGEFDASDVMNAYIASVQPELAAAMVTDAKILAAYVWNLGVEDDFHYADLDVPGTVIGDPMPTHDAATLRFPTLTRAINHGYKRIPGLAEIYVEDGMLIGSQKDALTALGAAIFTVWADGTPQNVCSYSVLKRIYFLNPKSGKWQYRLPKTDEELLWYEPLGCVLDEIVRTQNTRKKRV